MKTTRECCLLFWINPGSSTLQSTAAQPLTSYLANYPSKMTNTFRALLEKALLISNVFLWTLTYDRISVGWPVRTCILQLCTDIRGRLEELHTSALCRLENLSGVMDYRDRWGGRESENCAISTTWWCLY